MKEEDLPSVCDIERLSFPSPWHESTFRGEIYNRQISFPYVIVHKQENKVIGYVIYWRLDREVHINNIALHPDFRRKGIGETVLRWVLDQIQKQGINLVSLEVRPTNVAALSLYRKLGFRILGVRKNYYVNPREDALVLWRDLS